MKLYLIGGFLGSGKTTAIIHACQQLIKKDHRVAVITNDQGDQQVDSALVKSFFIPTSEVSNGCFCCNYDQLREQIHVSKQHIKPDIIFAESVGSCTDIIATVAKPYGIASPGSPVVISVFADAILLLAFLEGNADFINDNVRYIYKKQLQEADVLVINKTDLLSDGQINAIDRMLSTEYNSKIILYQSSFSETDIQKWLNVLNTFHKPSGRNSLEIDYDLYGDGEAQLAWLDKNISVTTSRKNAMEVANEIVYHIYNDIRQQELVTGHLKFFIEAPGYQKKISITTTSTLTDVLPEDIKTDHVRLLINARVQTEPSILKEIVTDVLKQMAQQYDCNIMVEKWAAFKPSYPRPVHRIS